MRRKQVVLDEFRSKSGQRSLTGYFPFSRVDRHRDCDQDVAYRARSGHFDP
ncbi:hypothetical protein ACFFL1_02835 [Samsonia erythrinae]|uniref:Uncharacterized protein n=1 Tax=Samsonia erythrinae TaxID=160434 RepID=A0A4R3VPR3_9GAMM|nr:hypothetical protein [Samsonia erythrinae]TCV09065.1 hypothetical protein EDC54_101589 [Samsonia erythrinae]